MQPPARSFAPSELGRDCMKCNYGYVTRLDIDSKTSFDFGKESSFKYVYFVEIRSWINWRIT